jgi:hypothetical protein
MHSLDAIRWIDDHVIQSTDLSQNTAKEYELNLNSYFV